MTERIAEMQATQSLDAAFEAYFKLQPDLIADPYPLFRRLRTEAPVFWSECLGGWVVTRYADVVYVLRHKDMSANRHSDSRSHLSEADREAARDLREHLSHMMGPSDPPDHTRLRALVNKAFTARTVEAMRPRIEAIADELLDAVVDGGQMDVIRDFAYPLPIRVICEMLGLPPEERDQFKRWSDDFITFIAAGRPTAAQAQQAQTSLKAMAEYFRVICQQRRREPREDLLTALIAAEEAGDRLSEAELLAMCNSLLAGGHETTTNLIGNGLLALLRHPGQFERLKAEPALTPTAVEELLRYDSPVQRLERFATADVEVGGQAIGQGQRIWLMLGAANRDPAQFADPEGIDLGRQPDPHVSFAQGIHFCVGAPLARLEGQIAFAALARRLPPPRLAAADLPWREIIAHRGVKSLPIAF